MGPMGNGGTGGMRYRGMSNRVQGYGAYRQRGTGGMGYKGCGSHGQWVTWAMGYRWYGAHGQWGTGGIGYKGYGPQAMGYMGNGAHGQFAPKISKRCQVVKKMSCCQKDVKCQKMKHLDYGGGSQKN